MNRYYLISIVILLIACKRKIETIRPIESSITESVYASGTIKTKDQYQIFPSTAGILEKIWVKEGDKIRKGDILANISSDVAAFNEQAANLRASYEKQEANRGKLNDAIQMAEIAAKKMRLDSSLYVRQRNLWNDQIGTRIELEQRELAWQNAKTEYLLAREKVKELERQLRFNDQLSEKNLQIAQQTKRDYAVKSQINGIVLKWSKNVGEFVNQQTSLGTIGDPQNLILEMQVDESDINRIKTGLPVLVTMDSYKNQVFEATVTRILPMMNDKNKTFLVEAAFVHAPEKVFAQTSFEANIILRTKDKALLIPRNYLLNDSTVLDKSGQAIRVVTGMKDYTRVEIVAGISANDELIKPK
ncbi:MAG: efflux RND transporter periplasmic adaptor subunit [Bacteroidota bacterium]